MTITLRSTKGSPLTYEELDANFTTLSNRTATGWQMIGTDPEVRTGAGNVPELKPFRGSIYQWAYPSTYMTESFINYDLPFDYAMGTDLYAAIHWSPGNSTSTGTVRFGIEFTYAKAYGSGIFTVPNAVYFEQASDGTPYRHYNVFNTENQKFPGSLAEPNLRFLARLFRDAEHPNDTFNGDVFVFGADFFYQVDKFGSASLYPPFV